MPILEHSLQGLLEDAYAFCWNHHYSGWKYRLESEGHEAIAKDCDASAKEFVRQLEEAIRKDEREKNG